MHALPADPHRADVEIVGQVDDVGGKAFGQPAVAAVDAHRFGGVERGHAQRLGEVEADHSGA